MSKRTLKYKTIAKSEEAPVVGSVVEEKDTIFVKQVSATEFEVFVSDETGYVVKLDKTIDKASFDDMVKAYIKEHSVSLRNVLNLTPSRFVTFGKINRSDVYDVIFHQNGEKKVISYEDYQMLDVSGSTFITYHYAKDDVLEIKGEDYPEHYLLVDKKGVIGKNITDSLPIKYIVADEEGHVDRERNNYVFGLIDNEGLLINRKTINAVIKKDSVVITDDWGISLISTLEINSTNSTISTELKSGENILYSVDGKMKFRLRDTVQGKVLDLRSGGASLYVGMPNYWGEVIEIDEVSQDIEVDLRDEAMLSGNVHFTIENNVGGDLEMIAYPRGDKENLAKTIIDGDNEIQYRELDGSYFLTLREQNGGDLTRGISITIKNAETDTPITSGRVDSRRKSIDFRGLNRSVHRIKIVIENT